jgi:diacylglycerol kinase (CTP)
MALLDIENQIEQSDIGSGLRPRSDLHIPRKLWHMTTGVSGLLFYYFSGLTNKEMGYALLVFGIVAFILDTIRIRVNFLNYLTMAIMKPFMRDSERKGYTGFSFYALGVALTLLFYEERVAILAIFFLVFSDPISSLFGILYGTKKILPNKSLQGTLAGGICCFFVALLYVLATVGFPDYTMLFVFSAGLAGALAELLSFQLDDNLTLPIFSGFFLTVVNSLFHIL